ncbi:MAG: GGDEF domain-containing protein [Oleibacter sp.]|nr:GGDEF domain-containing protein [Thalassolituus sp.]
MNDEDQRVEKLEEHRSMASIEKDIANISGLIEAGVKTLRFDQHLESAYKEYKTNHFSSVDYRLYALGIFIFWSFGWADFYFAGPRTELLLFTRSLISATLGVALYFTSRYKIEKFRDVVLSGGIYTCFFFVLWNLCVIEGVNRYFYHLGMIPMQIFVIIALRSNYRLMIITSFLMMLSYLFTLSLFPLYPPANLLTEMDLFAKKLLPFYIAFWIMLIVMGGYLSFIIEGGERLDFLKNRLLSLETERLQALGRRLHVLSTTDSLTGIANRRHSSEHLSREWRRCQRIPAPISLLMLDVDYFKRFNDFYGHQAGDACLQALAQQMNNVCRRPGDLCARYGGEEFLIILPESDIDQAAQIAENLRHQAGALAIEHSKSPMGVVTVSIGVASVLPDLNNDMDALIREADRMLYIAKGSGRNRVYSESE